MNWKIVVPALVATHVAAGGAGFFIARSLLVKDPAWLEANRKVDEQLGAVDRAVAASAPAAASTPPPGWTPGVVRFAVQDRGMSRVAFTSDAPLEAITGTTTSVTGQLSLDAGAVEKSTLAPIKVAVGTLKTGIDKRDEHLQGDGWFDTAKYPDAEFIVQSIEPLAGGMWPGRTADVTVHGTLRIKGIDKPLTQVVTLSWAAHNDAIAKFGIDGDLLRAKAHFDVKLSDFGMSAKVIGQKVAEVVQVDLNLTLVEQK